MRILFCTVAASLIALTAPLLVAQPAEPPADQAEQDDQLARPLTAERLINNLRSSYAERAPWAESIEITAGVGGIGRSETIELWLGADGCAAIDLGPLRVNVLDERIVVVHELDVGSYAVAARVENRPTTDGDDEASEETRSAGADEPGESDASEDPRATPLSFPTSDAFALLRTALPPVYDLPLHLALSADDDLSQPAAFADGVRWARPTVDGRGVATMRGTFAQGSVRLVAQPDPWRIRSVEIAHADGERLLRFEHRVIRGASRLAADRWIVDLSDRLELKTLTQLRARPGDVTPGRTAPPLPISDAADIAREAELLRLPRLDGARALVFFGVRDGGPPELVREALAAVESAGLTAAPVLVLGLDQELPERLSSMLARVAAQLDQPALGYALSPERTIRRFLAEGDAALVTIDGADVVRGVVRLDAVGDDVESDALERTRLLIDRAIDAVTPKEKPTEPIGDQPTGPEE